MLRLATSIVDGLLDPKDDLEDFVIGAFGSEFSSFMDKFSEVDSWPSGHGTVGYRKTVESDDGQVLLTFYAEVHRLRSVHDKGKGIELRFYLNTKLKKYTNHFDRKDMRLQGLTEDEAAAVAQMVYRWITGAVPAVLNNRPDNDKAYRAIPARLKFQLDRALHEFRKGEPYEPAIT